MIKYKSINGLPIDEQGNIVECQYSLVQGDCVLVFESHEKLMAHIKPDTSFPKRAAIEQEAEILFDEALKKYWYSRFDVQIYAQQGEQNAIKLIQYYQFLWQTIETNFSINNFDFSLPKLD